MVPSFGDGRGFTSSSATRQPPSTATPPASHFGVHWAPGDIAFLEQAESAAFRAQRRPGQRVEPSGSNALGLSTKSPFVVETPKKGMRCPHRIPLAVNTPDWEHWNQFLELVRAMLPIPKRDEGAYYLDAGLPNAYLALLGQMSSPLSPIVRPIWSLSVSVFFDELQLTNVAPLVITGLAAKNSPMLAQLAEVIGHMPRKLLAVGDPDVVVPPPFRRIATGLGDYPLENLMLLPWPVLGAVVVRKHMRKEA